MPVSSCDDGEHGAGRDGGVDRVAAVLQHLQPRGGRRAAGWSRSCRCGRARPNASSADCARGPIARIADAVSASCCADGTPRSTSECDRANRWRERFIDPPVRLTPDSHRRMHVSARQADPARNCARQAVEQLRQRLAVERKGAERPAPTRVYSFLPSPTPRSGAPARSATRRISSPRAPRRRGSARRSAARLRSLRVSASGSSARRAASSASSLFTRNSCSESDVMGLLNLCRGSVRLTLSKGR